MKGFGGLDRVLASTVHFITEKEYDPELPRTLEELAAKGILVAYADYRETRSSFGVIQMLADQLQLHHRPFGEKAHLLKFLDGLMAASRTENGVVMHIDSGRDWLANSPRELFDIIETFLTQVDDWFVRGKPCYLLIQVEPDERVATAFRDFIRVDRQ